MSPVQIVGVVNVTPDSFHDGGKFTSVDAAVAAAQTMIKEGADIIEIGGESTGPKSSDVSLEEELSRVIPAIKAIRSALPEARIGIDTWKSQVAEEAISAGVMMVNDVTAGRADPRLFSVIAKSDVRLVLMYAKDPSPRTTINDAQYDDVIKTIRLFLEERIAVAVAAGVPRDRILIDPGLGHFVSSDAQYSFQVLARLGDLAALESPIFLSPSRKSFVAGREKLPTAERLPGTIAASAIAVLNGAQYIRTHDVLDVRRACEIARSIRDA